MDGHQLEIEHVVPKSCPAEQKSEFDEDFDVWRDANLVVSCSTCNRLKSSFIPKGSDSAARLQNAREFVLLKRRIAEEYFHARVTLCRERRSMSREEYAGAGKEVERTSLSMEELRSGLLDALGRVLPETYKARVDKSAKTVSWLEVRNVDREFYWSPGIDADRGLTLQFWNAAKKWKTPEHQVLLGKSGHPQQDREAPHMRALIWAGYDPFNFWCRPGPRIHSIAEAAQWVASAIRAGEQLAIAMPEFTDE